MFAQLRLGGCLVFWSQRSQRSHIGPEVRRMPPHRRRLDTEARTRPALGLSIWADPSTGFYCSQEAAMHRLDNPLASLRSPYWKLAAVSGGEGDEDIKAIRTEGRTP